MIVVDASVLVPALADDGPDGDTVRARLRGQTLTAPEVVDLEVTSVLPRFAAAGQLPGRRADLAMQDLVDLPVRAPCATAPPPVSPPRPSTTGR